MAAVAVAGAAGAISSFRVSPSTLFTSSTFNRTLKRLPFIIRASSPSPPPIDFNISFGVGTKDQTLKSDKTLKKDPSRPLPTQLFIPWIVRGEDGKLTLQSTPPARILHALAESKTSSAASAKKKKKEPKKKEASEPPKHSKAARRFYNENFREPQRLSKVLASAGVASRRSSEELIFEGKVTVNGSVCKSPQTRVDLLKDTIYVNGNRLSKKLPPKLYFALNKPKGYICSSGDEPKSVMSLFDDYWKSWNRINPGLPKPRLFTVGRLDVATTGLIIVTNDGDFAQRLAHPSSKLSREYIATIEGSVNRRHLIAISEGTLVEGIHCTPDSVELLPSQPDMTRNRLRIVVHEGRNHEVRELVKHAGLQLHSLKRVRLGGFRLPSDLGLGKHVELKPSDLKTLAGKILQNA